MTLKLRITCFTILCALFGFSQNINQPTDFVICDSNNDGVESFDLNLKSAEILGNLSPNEYQVSYYLSQADAESGINPLLGVFTNSSNPQTIYAKLENTTTGDFETTSFDLILLSSVTTVNSVSRYFCLLNENENVINFDFTSLIDEILDGTDPTGLQISFFDNELDTINNTNPIPNPENYEAELNYYYFARVENNAGCFEIVSIYLYGSVTPVPNTPTVLVACGSNGTAVFDLDSKIPEIIDGLDLCQGCFQLSFHNSFAEADTGENPLSNPYNNTSPNQTIYVRLADEPGECYNITTLELIVNNGEVPEVGTVPLQQLCPSDLENYDLTQFDSVILNGFTGVSLAYFKEYVDFTSNSNAIGNPSNYDLSLDVETVYVKVTNNDTGCYAMVEIQFDYNESCTVSCDAPLNMTYCYRDNDNRQFTYVSEDDAPLVVSFNAGSIHILDRLIIIDTDGVTELYNGFGNSAGDESIYSLSQLVFQSTGNSITVKVDSDFNNSCGVDDGYEAWDYNVFCSNAVGVIDVNAFLDANTNGSFEASEAVFTNGYFTYEKNNDGILNTITSSTGHAIIASDNPEDTYNISYIVYSELESCYTIDPSMFSDVSVGTGQIISVNFPVENAAPCEDLAVFLINSAAPPRPGFLYNNYLVLQNFGFTTIASGTVEFINDPLVQFEAVSNVNSNYVINPTSTGFTVDFVNLQPGEVSYILISLTCPSTVALGELITSTVNYLDAAGDLIIDNNSSSISQEVVGSYDPNDIMESHGRAIVFDAFTASNEYLYYTIRFQNVGTAEASFIRIEDALDAALDENTFQMLRSSHDYRVTRTTNDLEWYFEDIDLPAEQDDAEGSQGFVYFKIKPKAGYAIGDVIPNTAAIYFDFNAPVITNTFESEFVQTLSTAQFLSDSFSLVPNPATEELSISFKNQVFGSMELQVIDIQGKQILNYGFSEAKPIKIDVSSLQPGLYFVKLKLDGAEAIKKLMIQ